MSAALMGRGRGLVTHTSPLGRSPDEDASELEHSPVPSSPGVVLLGSGSRCVCGYRFPAYKLPHTFVLDKNTFNTLIGLCIGPPVLSGGIYVCQSCQHQEKGVTAGALCGVLT